MLQNNIQEEMHWDPNFYLRFRGFWCIAPLMKKYQQFFNKPPTNESFSSIAKNFYAQQKVPREYQVRFSQQRSHKIDYDWLVSKTRSVPTRLNCWHDIFNNLTWLLWPHSKWAINNRSCVESANNKNIKKLKLRTKLQNALAQFDECGMLVISTDENLFQLIKKFAWQDLFINNRDKLVKSEAIIFGHGILEKALKPYIGLTAKALCITVPKNYFQWNFFTKMVYIDKILAKYIASKNFPCTAKELHPLPVLGWPAWYSKQDKAFYQNKQYFRSRSLVINNNIGR